MLREATERGFAIDDVSTELLGTRTRRRESAALSDLDFVDAVLATVANAIDE